MNALMNSFIGSNDLKSKAKIGISKSTGNGDTIIKNRSGKKTTISKEKKKVFNQIVASINFRNETKAIHKGEENMGKSGMATHFPESKKGRQLKSILFSNRRFSKWTPKGEIHTNFLNTKNSRDLLDGEIGKFEEPVLNSGRSKQNDLSTRNASTNATPTKKIYGGLKTYPILKKTIKSFADNKTNKIWGTISKRDQSNNISSNNSGKTNYGLFNNRLVLNDKWIEVVDFGKGGNNEYEKLEFPLVRRILNTAKIKGKNTKPQRKTKSADKLSVAKDNDHKVKSSQKGKLNDSAKGNVNNINGKEEIKPENPMRGDAKTDFEKKRGYNKSGGNNIKKKNIVLEARQSNSGDPRNNEDHPKNKIENIASPVSSSELPKVILKSNADGSVDIIPSKITQTIMDLIASGRNLSGKVIRIQLYPPELGSINIKFVEIQNAININIQVESKETFKTVDHNIKNIKASLNIAGVNIEKINVSLNDRVKNSFVDDFKGAFQNYNKQSTGYETPNGSNNRKFLKNLFTGGEKIIKESLPLNYASAFGVNWLA